MLSRSFNHYGSFSGNRCGLPLDMLPVEEDPRKLPPKPKSARSQREGLHLSPYRLKGCVQAVARLNEALKGWLK